MTEVRHRTAPRWSRRALGVIMSAGLAATALVATAPASSADTPLRQLADQEGVIIGAAVANGPLANNSQYRQLAQTQFNGVTAENEMKWGSLESQRGQYNWGPADAIMDFAQANNQKVRGHTLVWHSQAPNWLNNGGFSGAQLQDITDNHIEVVAGRYAGQMDTWDVVNEAFNEDGTFRPNIWYQALGEDYIADAFRKAHEVDPDAKLYINDYNTDGINAKSNGMYNLVSDLVDEGVPIHGVGFQGHHILGQIPSSYQANLQRFADLGLDVAITELDIRMQMPATSQKLQQQADDYEASMNACLNVQRCTGVTVWGIGDAHSWVPDTFPGEGAALIYDEQYQPKPAWDAVHTALGGTTDPDPDPDPDPAGPCTVDYTVVNDWGSGFQGSVQVSNTGSAAVNNWVLRWSNFSGVTVTNGWNGVWTQSGGQTTVTHPSWNTTIQPGQSVTVGFVANKSGSAPTPSGFQLNGTACAAV